MSQTIPSKLPPKGLDKEQLNARQLEQFQQLKKQLFTDTELSLLEPLHMEENKAPLDPEMAKLQSLLFPQEEVRRLLFNADYDKLQAMLAWLDKSQQQSLTLLEKQQHDTLEWLEKNQQNADHLVQILPKAITELAQTSPRFTEVLAPQIEKSIQSSVKRNPDPLVDAIFPIIGPVIRKAISESLADMLKNINDLVEQSLSIESLRWRLEAKRTGKTYAEVALLRSMDYQVDQVFLIHQHTSILLAHASSPNSLHQDADMVSGMLSAVQDFVKDAFRMGSQDTLSEIKLGDFTLILEKGPEASLIAAVLGKPPSSVRQSLKNKLETIHKDYRDDFAEFEGDTSPFNAVISDLETLLVRQKREKGSQFKKKLYAALAILGFSAGFAFLTYYEYKQFSAQNSILDYLESTPGVVLLSDDATQLQGMVDPLVGDVKTLIKNSNLNLEAIDIDQLEWQFIPFLSLEESMIAKRVASRISLPEQVQYRYAENTLYLSGQTTTDWLQFKLPELYSIPGINKVDTSQLTFDAYYQVALEKAINKLETYEFYFDAGRSTLTREHQQTINALKETFTQLLTNAQAVNKEVSLIVIGSADTATGSSEINQRLRRERSLNIAQFVKQIAPNLVIKIGHAQAPSTQPTSLDKQRRVFFKIQIESKS